MSQPEVARKYLRWTMIAAAVAVVGLLFLPFAGFTERITYGGTVGYRDVEVAGIGTYGERLHFFSYPLYLSYVQQVVTLLAVGLIYVLVGSWLFYRTERIPLPTNLRTFTRLGIGAGVVFAVAMLVALEFVFPAVEDDTIWNTHVRGYITDWWPGWGIAVSLLGIGAMVWSLRSLSRSVSAAAE